MLLKDVIDSAANELGDIEMVTWPRATLINLLNQAKNQIILVRPDALSETIIVELDAGTKQLITNTDRANLLPSGALRLLGVTRNMGADGLTPGKAVKPVDRSNLDLVDPDWHLASKNSAVVKAFIYEEDEPDTFYVNPPNDGTGSIEVKVSKMPTQHDTAMNDTAFAAELIDIKDIYVNTIIEWILYKAFSFENSSNQSMNAANTHLQSFYSSIGLKTKVDYSLSPSGDKVENG